MLSEFLAKMTAGDKLVPTYAFFTFTSILLCDVDGFPDPSHVATRSEVSDA